MARAASEFPGNPSAPHEEGRNARAAVEAARASVARSFSVKPEELLFTSGGTEANNLAIHGLMKALILRGAAPEGLHVITSTIEHSSVLKTVEALAKEGVQVSYVDPGPDGVLRPEDVAAAVRPETALVTLAHVNSELGTVQPLSEIADAISRSGTESALSAFAPETRFPVIHADAAQSPLYVDAGPHVLRADMVSYDAQKVGGPKGVGVLYRDFSVPLAPLYGGGTQERSLRPGTENVPGIVGAGLAFALAKEGRRERAEKVAALRDRLVELVERAVPDARFTGSRKRRIANNAHFVIPGANGDYLAVLMDTEGVAVSPRSACVGSGEAMSHVVYALTKDAEASKETVRFSLGPGTTEGDVERAAAALVKSLGVARGKR
jgi:cysteine desulfurase